MGWRELSTDARHIDFWVRLAAKVGVGLVAAVVGGAYFGWWSYLWKVPPPIQALIALNAAVSVCVLWAFAALILHRYIGWPKRHPFQMPAATAAPPLAGDTAAASAAPSAPALAIRVAATPARQVAAGSNDIQWMPGELTVQSEMADGATRIVVRNVHPDKRKTGIHVWVDELREWSEEDQRFVEKRLFVKAERPWELALAGGQPELFHGERQRYRFLQPADPEGRMPLTYRRGPNVTTVLLSPGTWGVTLRLEWGGRNESRDLCFRFSKADRSPTLMECPAPVCPVTPLDSRPV